MGLAYVRSCPGSLVIGGLVAGVLSGCGSGGKPAGGGSGPNPNETTSVSVILTSTTNAFTSAFDLQLLSLTLTNQAGGTVTLLSGAGSPPITEFAHLNGGTMPYATVSVPQGVYTGANATVGTAQFTCVVNLPSGLNVSTYSQPNATVTIDVADPITIETPAMGLVLNLDLAKSETYESCVPPGGSSFSIQPTFAMTAADFSVPETGLANGNPASVRGIVGSVGSDGSFTLNSADGPALTIATESNTAYSGISSAAGIVAGMEADVDTVFGTNGALEATRVEVDDTDPTDLNIFSGPMIEVPNGVSVLLDIAQEQFGFISSQPFGLGLQEFNYGNAVFQTSGELTNLQSLPFTPSFAAANMVPGQNVSMTSHVSSPINNGSAIVPVTTVTLKPQTINGTIASMTTQGNFSVYAVALAPYDLFPDLAVQAGQNLLVTDPSTVMVYTDNSTLNADSSSLAVGSLLRFRGLIFNDGGTLRMDCAEIQTGVAE